MSYKEIVKAGYNSIANRYLAERTRDSADVRLLNDLIERLPDNASVLDAGCGAGVPISLMLSERFKVTGVDFSEAQIELAKKLAPRADFICRDMTELDFPENSFDGICSYFAIIHIPREEHRSLLVNFHRMLKPNGHGLLCLGAENLVDDIDENYLGTRMYWSHYDTDVYLKMLKDSGFSLIWKKYVVDGCCEGAGHLFVFVQKQGNHSPEISVNPAKTGIQPMEVAGRCLLDECLLHPVAYDRIFEVFSSPGGKTAKEPA